MSASAYLLKANYRVSYGLDRHGGTELWHVQGVEGWDGTSSVALVLDLVPSKLGDQHVDPRMSGAICTDKSIVDGPWVSQSGNGITEFLVLVTFDSNRRWGGAAYVESGTRGVGSETIDIPNYVKVQVGTSTLWEFRPIKLERAIMERIEPRDGSGITETQKTLIFSYAGRPFTIFGQTWIMLTPDIMRMRTNQTILRYRFRSKAAITAFPADDTKGVGVPIPAIAQLGEYSVKWTTLSTPTIVAVPPNTLYAGTFGDPTDLPFWGNRLVPI